MGKGVQKQFFESFFEESKAIMLVYSLKKLKQINKLKQVSRRKQNQLHFKHFFSTNNGYKDSYLQ